MADLRECIAVALESHGDQLDKAGDPYLVHVACVALAVPKRYQPVAWLHDVIEDGYLGPSWPVAIEQLTERCGLTPAEVEAISLLTRRNAEPYLAYIRKIARAHGEAGRIARLVKMADLKDNHGRLDELAAFGSHREADRLRRRYDGAIATLPAWGAL